MTEDFQPQPVSGNEAKFMYAVVGIALLAAAAMTTDCLFFDVCGAVDGYGHYTWVSPISTIFQEAPRQ